MFMWSTKSSDSILQKHYFENSVKAREWISGKIWVGTTWGGPSNAIFGSFLGGPLQVQKHMGWCAWEDGTETICQREVVSLSLRVHFPIFLLIICHCFPYQYLLLTSWNKCKGIFYWVELDINENFIWWIGPLYVLLFLIEDWAFENYYCLITPFWANGCGVMCMKRLFVEDKYW